MDTRARRPLVLLAGIIWVVVLGCRTGDLIASRQPTATSTATRTAPRPTFTRVPPTVEPSPTFPPPPTIAAVLPAPAATLPPTPTFTRPPATARPAPTKTPILPPTADPDQGFYYKMIDKGCITSPDTRAEGTVYNNGVPENGVHVRVSGDGYGGEAVEEFVTGTDPSDYKHIDPAWQGRYRLGIAEGLQMAGNWCVWVVDGSGAPLSRGGHFNTHDSNGCNTGRFDFRH